MRGMLALLSLPLLSLAACGGGNSVNSLGSVAPPGGGFDDTPDSDEPAQFLDVSTETTFDALGSFQSIEIDPDTGAQLYQGNAGTVASPSGTIAYSPRDGIFTVTISDSKAGIAREVRFQDPAHRTDFDPNVRPVHEVPDLAGFNYLAAADGSNGSTSTFFYQRPGTTTNYVTLGGFVHLEIDGDGNITKTEHGATVFGDPTPYLQVPVKGTGHYEGDFLATMINQESVDAGGSVPVFQWLAGSSSIDVDFAHSTADLAFDGTVGKGYAGDVEVNDLLLNVPSGSTFSASGTATLAGLGKGFAGAFSSASFKVAGTDVPIDFTSVNPGTSTAGASSIDGRFYGKDAAEVGGNFRIVGGIPDQRIDIHGAFTGARQ